MWLWFIICVYFWREYWSWSGTWVKYMDVCVHEMERPCVKVLHSDLGALRYVIDLICDQLKERGKHYAAHAVFKSICDV